MANPPTPIGPAPKVPDSSSAEADFDTEYEDFMTWQKTVMTPGINALASNVYDNALAAAEDASAAQAAAGQAGLHASAAGTAAVAAADSALTALAAEASAASLVEKYLETSATDPTIGRNGAVLVDGNWYVNTISGLQRAYTVANGWKNGISVIAGVESINGLQGAITSPTQAEAETGVEATKPMSALRVKQAIAAQRAFANQTEAEAGTNTTKVMSPQQVAQAIAALTPKSFQIGDTLTTAQSLSSPTWLACDGSIYLQSSYSELFALIGTIANGTEAVFGGNHVTNSPSYGPWKQAAMGSIVVAACSGGYPIEYSLDHGATWVNSGTTSLGSAGVHALTSAGTKFFQFDNSNQSTILLYSSNGSAWSTATLPTNSFWRTIAFGNGVYVLTSSTTAAATSADGVTWTARTFPSGINYVHFIGGKFVGYAAGTTTTRYTSADGVNWTTNSGVTAIDMNGSLILNGLLYLVSGGAVFRTSSDGLAWSESLASSHVIDGPSFGVCYSNGRFYATGAPTGATKVAASWPIYSYDFIKWFPLCGSNAASLFMNPVSTGSYIVFSMYSTSTTTLRIKEFTYTKATQFCTPTLPRSSNLKTYIKAK